MIKINFLKITESVEIMNFLVSDNKNIKLFQFQENSWFLQAFQLYKEQDQAEIQLFSMAFHQTARQIC